jgi:diketogulonate reductase-like aldo/keto reductase
MEPALELPALQKSIADLGVGYLDHYITHWPYAVDPGNTVSPAPDAARLGYDLQAIFLPVWREMEAAVDAGLVRSLGCSNSTAKKLAALIAVARIPPVAVQVEMHPCLAQPKLVAWAAANGIAITGYCPLGSPGRPDAYRADGDPDVLGSDVVLALAKEIGRSPAQVALKWAVQRGTVPLPRSTNPGRISENFEGACGAWSLSAAAMAGLESLDTSIGSVGRIMKGDNFAPAGVPWRDMWDEEWEPTATA